VQQAHQVAQEATYVTKDKFEKTVVGGCPNCGASVAPGAKFCGECGQPSKREKFCLQCGTKIEGTPKFCPECGAQL
jgi:predicted amidophosphoribosyltransferase